MQVHFLSLLKLIDFYHRIGSLELYNYRLGLLKKSTKLTVRAIITVLQLSYGAPNNVGFQRIAFEPSIDPDFWKINRRVYS